MACAASNDDPDPVPTCDLPSLQTHYPTGELPNPFDDWEDLPTCVSTPYDVMIVLGCPSDDDGTPSECQERRAQLALQLADAGYGDTFITTGGAVHNEFVEAEFLRDLLIDGGVDSASITLEPLAEHTDENLYYSGEIMADNAWTRAIVVSDADHLMYAAVCDANCCVKKGRLWTYDLPLSADEVAKVAIYHLFPDADPIEEDDCETSVLPMSLMCLNLDNRLACDDDFQL